MTSELRKKVDEENRFAFKIAYRGTDDNKETHRRFSEYCKSFTDDSYILGLKSLLENHEIDWKYQKVLEEVANLRVRVEEVAESIDEKSSKKVLTFG